MKIYTGYYANIKTYKEKGIFPVAISLGVPPWIQGLPNMRSLNPLKNMIKMEREEFTPLYNAILKGLDCKELVAKLEILSGGKDVVLLCFEKPTDFCHRQLVATWMTENGYEAGEFFIAVKLADTRPVKKKPQQMELF